MPLHILVAAGISIDVYTIEGSDPTITAPSRVEETIPDMSQVITGAKDGDKLIIHFDCTFYWSYVGAPLTTDLRIKVNGNQVGKLIEMGFLVSGTRRNATGFTRIYEITADGDYTVTVTWYYEGTAYNPQIQNGLRTLAITHVKG